MFNQFWIITKLKEKYIFKKIKKKEKISSQDFID